MQNECPSTLRVLLVTTAVTLVTVAAIYFTQNTASLLGLLGLAFIRKGGLLEVSAGTAEEEPVNRENVYISAALEIICPQRGFGNPEPDCLVLVLNFCELPKVGAWLRLAGYSGDTPTGEPSIYGKVTRVAEVVSRFGEDADHFVVVEVNEITYAELVEKGNFNKISFPQPKAAEAVAAESPSDRLPAAGGGG